MKTKELQALINGMAPVIKEYIQKQAGDRIAALEQEKDALKQRVSEYEFSKTQLQQELQSLRLELAELKAERGVAHAHR